MNNTSAFHECSGAVISAKYHSVPHHISVERLMRSANIGARSSVKVEDTLYNSGKSLYSMMLENFIPYMDVKIINYKMFDDWWSHCTSMGVRMYVKPYFLPTESKIFASIYIPARPHPISFKLSKETIHKFRKQSKSPALNTKLELVLLQKFGRVKRH